MLRLNKPGKDHYTKFNNNDINEYINNIRNTILPIDSMSLFLTIIEFTKVIDKFILNIDNELLSSLSSITWCWHQDIRQRYSKLDDELYVYCYILSWVNLCRLLNVKLYLFDDMENMLNNRSNEFEFIKILTSNDKEKIIISNNKIKDYNIKILWQSIILLWPCLYKYPYNDNMRLYLISLFSQFCYTITYKLQTNAYYYPKYYRKWVINNDHEHNNLIDYYANKFDYNQIQLNIEHDENMFLSCYFFDTELIFYYQLTRLSIVKKLFGIYNRGDSSFIYKYNDDNGNKSIINERIIKMISCFKESIIGFIENEFLKNDIWEDLKMNISRLYLMHGEYDRFIRDNFMQSEKAHSDEILNKIRPNDYQKINSLKEKIPKEFLNEYTDEVEKFIDYNKNNIMDMSSLYNLKDFKSEKESIYLTFICIEKWFSLSRIKISLKDIFYYDIITDINKISDIFDIMESNNNNIPLFVVIMKHSFVLDIKNKKIFHSLFFIESFTIWIILLIKYNIINVNTGLSKFKNFENFIQFIYKM